MPLSSIFQVLRAAFGAAPKKTVAPGTTFTTVKGPFPEQLKKEMRRLASKVPEEIADRLIARGKAARITRANPQDKWIASGTYWTGFTSSNVHGAAYYVDDQEMLVGFHGGQPGVSYYMYQGVTEGEARDFYVAPSKGEWIWTNFRIRGTALGHQKEYTFLSGPSTQTRKWNRSRPAAREHALKVAEQSVIWSHIQPRIVSEE